MARGDGLLGHLPPNAAGNRDDGELHLPFLRGAPVIHMRECPENGGTAVHSERDMASHLRRRAPRRAEEPANRTVTASTSSAWCSGA